MIEPHGGRLVDRTAVEPDSRELAAGSTEVVLSQGGYQDLLNIANGRFSPLEGFLSHDNFHKVVQDMTLEDGTVWPLPVVLDVDGDKAAEITPDERATLCAPDRTPVGVIDVEEIFKYNKQEAARGIYGTDDEAHPGVADFFSKADFLIGGPIKVFGAERYNQYDLLPKESRVLFRHKGWDSVAGFQTRNAPHRAHEYIQKSVLEFVDSLLIQPKLGDKKSGDYRDDVIMETYHELVSAYYPNNSVTLSVFPSRMRYAGPREAIFDAIVRKNQGCTHFIVGRDHAGVEDYYDRFSAHRVFDEIADIDIQPIFFDFAFYCSVCDGMASEKICPHDDEDRVYPSGSDIRASIRGGSRPSEKVMRPEVANFIIETDQPFLE